MSRKYSETTIPDKVLYKMLKRESTPRTRILQRGAGKTNIEFRSDIGFHFGPLVRDFRGSNAVNTSIYSALNLIKHKPLFSYPEKPEYVASKLIKHLLVRNNKVAIDLNQVIRVGFGFVKGKGIYFFIPVS